MANTILHKIKKNQDKEQGSGQAGKKAWGEKTQKYLEEKSRISVEDHSNTFLLYYELDYLNSYKNFYGECLHKKFKPSIKVFGTIAITSEENKYENEIVQRNTNMEFGVFIEHLKELGINPQLGDFFYSKNKWYIIHSKTALDDNATSVAFDKAITIKFLATQVDDEVIAFEPWNINNSIKQEVQNYLDSKNK